MKPYTPADIETDLVAAIHAGDQARIDHLGGLLDHLPPPPAPSLHASALWYAEQGLHVFPLQPGSKVPPKGLHWRDLATTDPALITSWWEGSPRANIGIATGHLVDVIDIDGPTGVTSYLQLVDDLPPVYGKVSTPRPGGSHLYVAAVPGRGNKAGLLPGVDYRATGGYVVAPPSVNADGVPYVWRAPLAVAELVQAVAA